MEVLKARKYEFESKAVPPDTFGVVRFEGSEGLSTCYRFDITLVSTKADIDLNAVLQKPVVFTILREEGDIPFHGILAEFEQQQAFDEYVFYRAVLTPKFWWLQLTHHNQVFLDMNVPDILAAVLKDGGLTANDYSIRLQKNYPQWEYICQYRESHFNFASRWMEREGIYYFFEQTPSGEKLVLTDTGLAHTPMPEGRTMYYSPPSGLDETRREEVIQTLLCNQRMLPHKVILKDYNYRTPSLELQGEAPVVATGRGDVFIYGEHFRTTEEGNALARIRAEELICREKLFLGESTIPYLRPGYVFDLEDHYRGDYNQGYLTTEIHHQGSQTAYLISGLQDALSATEKTPYYRNRFTVIPNNIQYRPERRTEPSRFYGTMNARIDASGSGKYAELDDQGRYKVILPFDLSGRGNGKASAFLRMAQPYAGTDHGMHFPLHKGTEILLTFIDGNPDRPIVSAAVPNPVTPSPLHSGNQTMAHITTSGQNKLHFEDMEGGQRALLSSPTANSWFRVGAHNDPAVDVDETDFGGTTGNGIRLHSNDDIWQEAQRRYVNYRVGLPTVENDMPSGCKYLIKKMWQYNSGEFHPTGMAPYTGSWNLRENSQIADEDARKEDLNKRKWQYLVSRGEVRIAKGDTFITQDGNIYDFGGYWNYNLGNSYVEAHIDQSAELNANHDFDLINNGNKWSSWETKAKTNGTIKNELHSWNNGEVWVEKKFGHSYNYNEGHQLNVNVGSTQNIKVWGEYTDFEEEYSDTGRRVARSEDDGHVKKEWKYSPDYDACMSYEVNQKAGGTLNSFKYEWSNKATAEFSFASSVSFKFEAAISFSLGITLAAKIGIDINSTTEIAIKVPYLTVFSLNIERGGETKIAVPGAAVTIRPATPVVEVGPEPVSIETRAGARIFTGLVELTNRASASIESDGLIKCIL